MTDLRQRPHDDAAERALLGAVLTGYPADRVRLTPADFYGTRNGDTWAALQRIADSGRRPDPTLALGALGVESAPYLAELVAEAGIGSNVAAYARTIAQHADANRIMDLALGMLQQAESGHAPDTIAEHVRAELDRLERRTGTTVRLDEVIPHLLESIEAGGTRGPAVPWPDLDHAIRGLQPGRLYVIGARPGVGKSLVGQALAWHWAKRHGLDTFVASLEMPRQEYAMRFLAAEAGVRLRELESGRLTDGHWDMINASTAKMAGVPLWLCDDDTQTVRSIAANARAAARGGKLGLIVVDYLQLMTPTNTRVKREEQVSDITRRLKQIAKRLSCPVVLLSQLNRESVKGDSREPRLSDLRESGAIEQDADVVMLLHRLDDDHNPDPNAPIPLDAIVSKNRGGPPGVKVPLLVQGNLARIVARTAA